MGQLVARLSEPCLNQYAEFGRNIADVASDALDRAQLAFKLLDAHGTFQIGRRDSQGRPKAVDSFGIQTALDGVPKGPVRVFVSSLLPDFIQ